jgi:phosphate starvation-inducible PhoH-like protein
MQQRLLLSSELASELTDNLDARLRQLDDHLDADLSLRGETLTISGSRLDIAQATTAINQLKELTNNGYPLTQSTLDTFGTARHDGADPTSILNDVIWRHRGLTISPKTPGQKQYLDAIRDHTLTFGLGPAGSGKSFLAVALAVHALTENSVSRIILTRPAVEAGERLGFLPGDIRDKLEPYLRPLLDALLDMLDAETVTESLDNGTIEVAPLAYMRGRTLNDAFIIADEMQNSSPEQMKMLLTRIGFNSKIVVTGDVTQGDLGSKRSGLAGVSELFAGIDDIACVSLTTADVVRHKLVQKIVAAYDQAEAA